MHPIIVLLLSPAVIAPLTTAIISRVKRLPTVQGVEDQSRRNLLLRGLAALLSFLGIIGAFLSTGILPDPTTVSDILVTLILTFSAFVGSLGVHNLGKKK